MGLAQESPPMAAREPEPRFGIPVKLKVYPQLTAKKALESALDAYEKGDHAYLVAHLLDPAFVEQRITDLGKQYEAKVEIELSRLRDLQFANPDRFAPEDRLPTDRAQFLARITARSRDLAFRKLLLDIDQQMRNDPQSLKDMKKILRDGTFSDEGMGAKVVHPSVKYVALYFRKIGDCWYLENRQTEETKKEPQ
jgi:hypothetical protein